jgi:GDP-mannose transporter
MNSQLSHSKLPLLPFTDGERAEMSKTSSNTEYFAQDNLQAVLSSIAYASCSVMMVLINKFVALSVAAEYRHAIPNLAVVWLQCAVAVFILEVARSLNFIEYPLLQWTIVKVWIPVNIIFVAMLTTSFLTFVYLSVPMINIMKNLTNVITIFGDWTIYGERPSWFTFFTILLMTVGAVMAGVNDLEFSWIGYFWMIVNCACTAFYTLYMRYVSVNVKLPRLGMVFYNNILSLVILTPLCFATRQHEVMFKSAYFTPAFIGLNLLAGLLGVCLNFASLWCVGKTSATNYAIVGSLCKIPSLVLGFVLFYSPVTWQGLVFIVMGTLGGLLYGYSKLPA